MLKDDKEESTVKVFVWPDGSWRYACDIDELISHGGYTDDFAVLSVNLDVVDTDEGMDALVFNFLKMHKGASANKGIWRGTGGMSKESYDLFQKIPITKLCKNDYPERCPERCPDKGITVFQKEMIDGESPFIRISFHPSWRSGEKVKVLDIALGQELVHDALQVVDISTGAVSFLSTQEHIKKRILCDRDRLKKVVMDTLYKHFDSLLGIKDTENGYQKGE